MGGDSAVVEESEGVSVNINVRCSNGSKFSVQTSVDSIVSSFKDLVARNCDVPVEQQRLIYKGRILKDDQTLRSYGLEADHTVHLVRGFVHTNSTGGTSTSSTDTNTATNNARGAVANEGGSLGGPGFGASLFPGLGINGTGGNALFGDGFPDLEQMQQPFLSNPNLVREIMNSPAMQNLMNNPEIVRNLIMNNPQMQELMDRNPELAHILNDPSTLRQTLEATRNPEIMREMMRNTDRAMSNIESSPEGFNMLRRMYENIQEPFLNATTMAGNTGNNNAAISGTHGGHARDQSTNPSTTSSEATAGSPLPNTNPLPNPWSSTGTGGAQNNTRRSSTTGVDARQQGPTGLGGLNLPDLENMLGGNAMPDASLLTQLMQNPAISQMMQSMLSNPQTLNQILGANTEQRGMPDLNSLRDVMQNPEFLRMFSSPETLQQLLSFQQALMSQLGQQQSTRESGQTGGGTGPMNNLGLEMLSSMFGGLGAGSLAVPNRSNEPPEQLYASQLSQLQEMGFFDTQENIRALVATSGNVHAAVERLLGNSGQ
ncbi:ubiquitin domain-containing protein DSK2a-like isoform X2 [Vigna umbellata]|uniref:ubiquitin domain-containing protein DSK2a-like isoform X2 n=1 Tax=Vigna umbellata TaxID=87088 RepID=UPI001F5EA982|nr:ubiquitin domain-containing protein DSK2a-like isoform X2 [Vigna umbellata]